MLMGVLPPLVCTQPCPLIIKGGNFWQLINLTRQFIITKYNRQSNSIQELLDTYLKCNIKHSLNSWSQSKGLVWAKAHSLVRVLNISTHKIVGRTTGTKGCYFLAGIYQVSNLFLYQES